MAISRGFRDRLFDTNLFGISIDGCECNQCRHVAEDGMSCVAFPERIPSAILGGKVSHRKPYPGDNGIRFEPREGE